MTAQRAESIPIVKKGPFTYDGYTNALTQREKRRLIKKKLETHNVFVNTEQLDSSDMDGSNPAESDAPIHDGVVIANVTAGGRSPFAGEYLTLDYVTGKTLTGIPDDWCPDEYIIFATALKDGTGRIPVRLTRRDLEEETKNIPKVYCPEEDVCSGFSCLEFTTSGGAESENSDCTGVGLPLKFSVEHGQSSSGGCATSGPDGRTKIILQWAGDFTQLEVATDLRISGGNLQWKKQKLCLPSVFIGEAEQCVEELPSGGGVSGCASLSGCCNFDIDNLQVLGHQAGSADICFIDTQTCSGASGGA